MMPAKQYQVLAAGDTFSAELRSDKEIVLDGSVIPVSLQVPASDGFMRLEVHGKIFLVLAKRVSENEYDIWINHHVLNVTLQDSRSQLLTRFASAPTTDHQAAVVKAPMPGLVTAIEVKKGESVKSGQGLIILEAMKMENEIRSPISGVVSAIDVELRAPVEKGQRLLVIEPSKSTGNET